MNVNSDPYRCVRVSGRRVQHAAHVLPRGWGRRG